MLEHKNFFEMNMNERIRTIDGSIYMRGSLLSLITKEIKICTKKKNLIEQIKLQKRSLSLSADL